MIFIAEKELQGSCDFVNYNHMLGEFIFERDFVSFVFKGPAMIMEC